MALSNAFRMNRNYTLIGDGHRFGARPLRAALWLGALLLMITVSGCQDPNKMFEGVWVSEAEPHDALGGELMGAPVLAIGHFGRNVTGVTYFRKFAYGEYTDHCSCAFIRQRAIDVVDVKEATMAFTTTCENPEDETQSPVTLLWQLALSGESVDEQRLTGTVRRADDQMTSEDVAFDRVSTIVEETQKQCPP